MDTPPREIYLAWNYLPILLLGHIINKKEFRGANFFSLQVAPIWHPGIDDHIADLDNGKEPPVLLSNTKK